MNAYKTITATLALSALSTMALAQSAESTLTEADMDALKTAWGEGIVKIGSVHTEGGDYRTAAQEHIEMFYAYGEKDVLFKPTLASDDQFRGTFEEALSYFVGGDIAEDGGFAIAPYSNVRWENEGTVIDGDTGMSMGNYYFTTSDGSEIKVEYTFGVAVMEDGTPKIVLHHSSLPFTPG